MACDCSHSYTLIPAAATLQRFVLPPFTKYRGWGRLFTSVPVYQFNCCMLPGKQCILKVPYFTHYVIFLLVLVIFNLQSLLINSEKKDNEKLHRSP